MLKRDEEIKKQIQKAKMSPERPKITIKNQQEQLNMNKKHSKSIRIDEEYRFSSDEASSNSEDKLNQSPGDLSDFDDIN